MTSERDSPFPSKWVVMIPGDHALPDPSVNIPQAHQFDDGKDMDSLEYKSTKAQHEIVPRFVAEPIAWGAYFFSAASAHYRGPSPARTAACRGCWPRYSGAASQRWENLGCRTSVQRTEPAVPPLSDSRGNRFARGVRASCSPEGKAYGVGEELCNLRDDITKKVIPRLLLLLLRPLETERLTLIPCLVHRDLRDGNASVGVLSGSPRIIDGVCFYVHPDSR